MFLSKTENTVMRRPISQKKDTFFKPAPHAIQRKCAGCEDEDKQIYRKENQNTTVEADADLSSYVSSLSSSGQSLPESSRQFFEPRFGQDFSNVKVHTDSVAAKSAQSINALAYTTGNNIVFNQGQYAPGTESGQRLMAHELTHVVQQNSTIQTKMIQRTCSDGHCETCAGGQKNFPITIFFRRPATPATMATVRTQINETRTILNKCCLTLNESFNNAVLPGGGVFNFLDNTSDPARWHYTADASNLGTGNTFARSTGIPILVVDDVPGSGGGVTVDSRFDPNYRGRTYAAISVNQTAPNNGCTHLAHELWHIGSGIVGHDPAHGTLAACTGNAVSPEYCSGLRAIVGG